MIYTSPGFWNSYGKNKTTGQFEASWSYYPLWIAHYTTASAPILPEPWKSANVPWLFWQHSNTGDGLKFGAESKAIDLNWFNGSQAELERLAGIDAPLVGVAQLMNPLQVGVSKELEDLTNWVEIIAKRVSNIENHCKLSQLLRSRGASFRLP